MSESNRVSVAYQAEATFATDPTSASTNAIRRTGGSFGLDISLIESAEVRSDRLTAGTGIGSKTPSGSIDFEASYGAHDDLMAGAFQNSWATAASNTALTLTISGPAAWAATGGAVNLAVGDVYEAAGTNGATNDGYWLVTGRTDDDNWTAVNADTGANPATETATTAVSTTHDGSLIAGTTRQSFLIEEEFGGTTIFAKWSGCVIGGMNLDISPDSLITGSFSDIQAKTVTYSATAFDATPTAAAANEIFSSVSDVQAIVKGSTDMTTFLINNLSWNLNNNVRSVAVVSSGGDPGDIRLGKVQVGGTINAYLDAALLTHIQSFAAFTTTSLSWSIGDLAGNRYYFHFPSVKIVGGSPAAGSSDSDVPVPFEFTAFRDSVSGSICHVTRIDL